MAKKELLGTLFLFLFYNFRVHKGAGGKQFKPWQESAPESKRRLKMAKISGSVNYA